MAPEPADRRLADRYRLGDLIATGGMAQVWTAHDELLNRDVAVKILHAHLARDESFVRRFRREALAAARLNHPNIVAIYDSVSEDRTEAIVMQLVRGETLRSRLDQRRSLGPKDAIPIAVSVASALQTAHEAGIVHRDVKPANILLTDDGEVMVADFGIAKAGDASDLTRTGSLIGTAKYLSPEQVQGETIDAQTDVYALGVVLYEMLTGRPPFAADSDLSTALARVNRDPLLPRQIKPGLPRRVENIVMKAMARERPRRYGTAAELRAALLAGDASLDPDSDASLGEPVDSNPGRRFGDSERAWLIPTALIAATALVLGVAGWIFGRTDPGRELVRDVVDVVRDPEDTVPPSAVSTPVTNDAPGTTEAPAAPTRVTYSITEFDPDDAGVSGDNPGLLPFLSDGHVEEDPRREWKTEGYFDQFGQGYRRGIGLLVELSEPADLRRLELVANVEGWSAEVYATSGAEDTLEAWRQDASQVARIETGATGSNQVDLGGRPWQRVLVWFTAIPPRESDGKYQMRVAELSVQPAS